MKFVTSLLELLLCVITARNSVSVSSFFHGIREWLDHYESLIVEENVEDTLLFVHSDCCHATAKRASLVEIHCET